MSSDTDARSTTNIDTRHDNSKNVNENIRTKREWWWLPGKKEKELF
jgi:hypothetical protein